MPPAGWVLWRRSGRKSSLIPHPASTHWPIWLWQRLQVVNKSSTSRQQVVKSSTSRQQVRKSPQKSAKVRRSAQARFSGSQPENGGSTPPGGAFKRLIIHKLGKPVLGKITREPRSMEDKGGKRTSAGRVRLSREAGVEIGLPGLRGPGRPSDVHARAHPSVWRSPTRGPRAALSSSPGRFCVLSSFVHFPSVRRIVGNHNSQGWLWSSAGGLRATTPQNVGGLLQSRRRAIDSRSAA
jgi:hypothetical protein